jgi:hypothetical protein
LTRLSGASQYLLTPLGFLAVNQGVLTALGSKQNINFTDPTKGDWLAFKAGGLEWSLPGLHSEIKTLGKILATSLMNDKEFNRKYPKQNKQAILAEILGQYALGKAHPTIGLAKEVLTGTVFPNRPVPWSSEPGTAKMPRMSWPEYAGKHMPIPLTGPIGYVFDQMRKNGASTSDALSIIRGLIAYGLTDPKGLTVGPQV